MSLSGKTFYIDFPALKLTLDDGILKEKDVREAVKECIKDEHINSDGEVIHRLRKIFGEKLI